MKLILASAKWCGPCQVIKLRLKSEDLTDKVEVKDADLDTDFFKKNSLRSVPRLLVMDGDEIIETIQGADDIINRIKQG